MLEVQRVVGVDLFCGGGGLTHGLLLEGIRVTGGFDVDPTCAFAYRSNNENAEFICGDVKDVTEEQVRKLLAGAAVSVIVGCAPCTPFSSLQQGKQRWRGREWRLLRHFARLAADVKPAIVSMENVPAVANTGVFKSFVKTLEEAGYNVTSSVASCPEYGVPQTRRRLILLASQFGPIQLVPPTHDKDRRPTVRQAFAGFAPLTAGEAAASDPLHRAARLTPVNLQRMKASRPGGTWRDWPEELRLRCHKKKKGRKFSGVYGRMEWDAPGPTITTQCCNYGSGRFGHPEEDRAITPREAAALQTFPTTYRFVDDPASEINIARQIIGNAVPVMLARAIGKSIIEHVKKHVPAICVDALTAAASETVAASPPVSSPA